MNRLKKPLLITLAVAGALVILAVLLGVLNALVGGGEWTFGWTDYRYDDSGYSVGDGTVYTDALTELDVDWLGGRVEIVICQDFYPSVSERLPSDASESSRMRFRLGEDGKTLFVKCRAPSTFFGGSENARKDLTVRIPERMLSHLETLRINSASADIAVEAAPFARVLVESSSGRIALGVDARTDRVEVRTSGGDVTLSVPETPSFTLEYVTEWGGEPDVVPAVEHVDGGYVCGTGETAISVQTVGGKLKIELEK